MTDPIDITPAGESDLGLIYGNWLDSFYDAHAAGPLPGDVYRASYRETIDRILARAGVRALIARSPRDADALYGFVVAAPGILYYLYVKQPYRRRGIADALMREVGFGRAARFTYLFKTELATALGKRWQGARWDPIAARRLGRETKESL